MIGRFRSVLRTTAGGWVGERPIPIGNVARRRRLLRHALAGQRAGRVLVVGPGLAARQAVPDATVDVVGTSPHSAEVTVCSAARGAGSLPAARWDTIIFTETGQDFPERLDAVLPACRPAARLLVVDRADRDADDAVELALAKVSDIRRIIRRADYRVLVSQVSV